MSRKKSKAVQEGNGLVPQDISELLSGITTKELRRIMSQAWDEVCDEYRLKRPKNPKQMRATEQRSASLAQDDRQPRLAIEAKVTIEKKTRERTEGAAAVVQAKHGDSCSAKRVQAGPLSSTTFCMKAELPALSRWDDVLVDKGTAVPKPCRSPAEMRPRTAAVDLLPAGKASTATRII